MVDITKFPFGPNHIVSASEMWNHFHHQRQKDMKSEQRGSEHIYEAIYEGTSWFACQPTTGNHWAAKQQRAQRYHNLSLLEIHKPVDFSILRRQPVMSASSFLTTSCCEQFFSKTHCCKDSAGSRLTGPNLENEPGLKEKQFQITFQRLVSCMCLIIY